MTPTSRRNFLKTTALAAPYIGWKTAAKGVGPNDTIHLASFGGGGRAGADINGFASVPGTKLVAMCDLDQRKAMGSMRANPDATFYSDWREMLDKEADNFVGIGCGTPDHMHAPMTMRAMELGKHVYTQKPLTRTLHECRTITDYALENKIATQMGNQLGSGAGNKTAVAALRSGIIGKVSQVHSMNPKTWGTLDPFPDKTDEIPAGFDWDAWLGVAEDRPFVAGQYHPGQWRKRLDFGTATLGDMGCHIVHPWMKGLNSPTPISVTSHGPGPIDDHSWPINSHVVWEFEDGITAAWYDGNQFPDESVQAAVGGKANVPTSGSVIIGDNGALAIPHGGGNGGMPVLYRDGVKVEGEIKPIDGGNHFADWISLVRGEIEETVSDFRIAGPATEVVLMGTVSLRVPGETLKWDAKAAKFTNSDAANALVKEPYRTGWEVKGL